MPLVTLILDVLFPTESNNKWRTFIETDGRLIEPDGEFFVNTANGIGVSGSYQGVVLANTWHRIAFAVDQADGVNRIRKYIDGVEVGTQGAGAIDGRWALSPGGIALLFSDNDGDVAPGFVNSIQIYDVALPKSQIAAFGAAQCEVGRGSQWRDGSAGGVRRGGGCTQQQRGAGRSKEAVHGGLQKNTVRPALISRFWVLRRLPSRSSE